MSWMDRVPQVLARSLGALVWLGLAAGCDALDVEEQAKREAYQERYAKAKALFEERCKTAGVVVKRTVKDVEGIELIKIRPEIPWGGKEYFDPMFPGAAMAGEVKGDDYLKQFFMTEYFEPAYPERRGGLGPETREKRRTRPAQRRGYAFVERIDASNGQRYRCTPDWSLDHPNWVPGQHQCKPIQSTAARYALDYEDIVNAADRAHWVAGTKLRVFDKQTGEVIAELTRFVWDAGFGEHSTGRWPWAYASTSGSTECPNVVGVKDDTSRKFIDTVLIPKQGD